MNFSKSRACIAACLLVLGLAAVPASAAAAPTRYEAENATISQGVVESNHAGFSGTGFVNGDNVAGSSVEWTINAPSAGTATLAFRYANGTTADRPSDISVNGATVAAARSFPVTGAWSTWATVTLTAPLTAGSNTVRATATGAGGNPNFDYLDAEVQSTSFTDYQAETATISQGVVESNHAGFTGSGFVNYDNVTGSSVEFTVSAAASGTQSLTFRYANGTTTNRPMAIAVNGTTAATVNFPGTGAWSTWQEVTVEAALNAGGNTVTATATTAGGGPNLDRLRVSGPGDTEKPTPPGQPSCSQITHNALTLDWPPSTDNIGVAGYDIYHQGQQIATATAPPHRLTGLTPDFAYQLSVFARDASGNVSPSSPEANCRTQPAPADDPPTAPGRPTVSGVQATSATVTWAASTDDNGVRAYLIRDHATNAVLATVTGTPPATTAAVPLECARTYQVHVVARDTANQLSAPSQPSASFTTAACGSVPQPPASVAGGFDVPWDISWAPDGTYALVTERDTFRVFKVTTSGTKTQVGTVPNSQTTGGEGGLMGLDFSPTWNGTTDQDVFFMHTAAEGNRIAKMSFNGTTLSGYASVLQGIDKNRYHNGGRIRFGPDGYLYVATGDAQQSSNAPDLDSLNGKILRITKTGAAAPGNPFGTRVYSYGHRNPQGLAWDSAGRLWSSELGNSSRDELNLILPGRNYGWPTCEGTCDTSGMTNPKRTWGVAEASPSGIAIVNNTIFMAALRGQRLWRIVLNGENVSTVNSYFNGTYGRLRAVEKVPGASAIWFGSTNSDNNGDGSADTIRRSAIQ